MERYRLIRLAGQIGGFCGCLLVVLQLSACARLRVITDPPGSMVTIKDASGKVVREHAAPIEVQVNFSRSHRYIIEAKPSMPNDDGLEPVTEEVSASDYNSLPEVRNHVRELMVQLSEGEYKQIRVIKLILDPEQGWVGVVTEERAYREITEEGGAVPTRVVEFEDDDLGIIGLALDPAGAKIVFSVAAYDVNDLDAIKSLRLDEHREMPLQHANLRAVPVTGGPIQHITTEYFQDLYPAFTEGGEYVLFSSNRRRSNFADILRTRVDGRGGISNVYIDQRGARAIKPSQAKDGTIAFALYPSGWRKPGDVQIWTVGGPNQLPTQIARGIQPQISPYGQYIAYIGKDGNLWVVRADGTDATQLTLGAVRILEEFKESLKGVERTQFEVYDRQGTLLRHYHPYSFPSWSSDATRILYTSMEGPDSTGRPNQDIWIMNHDGTEQHQLTTNGSVDRFPLMSPNQKYVYFMSNRGLKWAIWRIAAPGGDTND